MPELATTSKSGRYYEWGGVRYPSVTTILGGGIPKPALVAWAKRVTAEAAIASLNTLPGLLAEKGERAVIQALTKRPEKEAEAAAVIGTAVHAAIEQYAKGGELGPWPEEAEPFRASFTRFLEEKSPVFELSEFTVFNLEAGYAGTADAACRFPGRDGVTLLDVKTGKGVYPEVALQLAAYAYGEFIGRPDGSEVLPEFSDFEVLHVRPDAYELVPVRVDLDTFATFLAVKDVFEWVRVTSKFALGGSAK